MGERERYIYVCNNLHISADVLKPQVSQQLLKMIVLRRISKEVKMSASSRPSCASPIEISAPMEIGGRWESNDNGRAGTNGHGISSVIISDFEGRYVERVG
jgi:hypothetical protein